MPVRDAATIMLVRDGQVGGVEVFLVRRALDAVFVGGAYVFPGGAVDPSDGQVDLQELCPGRDDAAASTILGVTAGGLIYWVTAVRECFEEAGVLLACDRMGRLVSLRDPAAAERFGRHRVALHAGERSLADICRTEGLRLAVDRVQFWSRWITPEGPPRRFDTRFFVAVAPDEQVPLHDAKETIANAWVRPAEALAGDLQLPFPTRRHLEALAAFPSTAEVMRAAGARERLAPVQPRVLADAEGIRHLLPGDPGYDDLDAPPAEVCP